MLLVTEEDYEQTDCSKAGSFQTWWVKRLDGTKDAIVPLDKVELSDLGSFPLPQGAFCSAHWFDLNSSGIVAAGFYGGGTQLLDVRNPSDIKAYGHAIWGASEVWDATGCRSTPQRPPDRPHQQPRLLRRPGPRARRLRRRPARRRHRGHPDARGDPGQRLPDSRSPRCCRPAWSARAVALALGVRRRTRPRHDLTPRAPSG